MNKLSLIFDKIHKLTDSIQVAEDTKELRLILNNKLDARIFYSITEVIDNTFIALDETYNRYLIDKKGNIIKSWGYNLRYDADLINIGEYLDSLKVKDILESLYKNRLNLVASDRHSNYDTCLTLEYRNDETNTVIIGLYNKIRGKSIHSLIVKNMREQKFVSYDENNNYIANDIEVIDDKFRYIEKYVITNDIMYFSSGIYNGTKLITPANNYKKYNNSIIVWVPSIKSSEYTSIYRLIYNNKIKLDNCKYLL